MRARFEGRRVVVESAGRWTCLGPGHVHRIGRAVDDHRSDLGRCLRSVGNPDWNSVLGPPVCGKSDVAPMSLSWKGTPIIDGAGTIGWMEGGCGRLVEVEEVHEVTGRLESISLAQVGEIPVDIDELAESAELPLLVRDISRHHIG